jgi:hypothetical protein
VPGYSLLPKRVPGSRTPSHCFLASPKQPFLQGGADLPKAEEGSFDPVSRLVTDFMFAFAASNHVESEGEDNGYSRAMFIE